ncbi:MAG TPA: hypothetical protein VEC57_17245 [Candidatus Limnocylindrales bacterium]|nr:hypothetical protein [Candidatus Limnocylindrales bacterium]
MTASAILACFSLAAAVAAGLWWWRLIDQVRVGEGRPKVLALVAVSVALAALALRGDPGTAAAIAAWIAMAAGAMFLLLLALGRQSRREIAVRLGRPILRFVAPDEHGQPFDIDALAGRPYLLKFFRGHW